MQSAYVTLCCYCSAALSQWMSDLWTLSQQKCYMDDVVAVRTYKKVAWCTLCEEFLFLQDRALLPNMPIKFKLLHFTLCLTLTTKSCTCEASGAHLLTLMWFWCTNSNVKCYSSMQFNILDRFIAHVLLKLYSGASLSPFLTRLSKPD